MEQFKKDNAVVCPNCGNAYFESEGKCPRCSKIYKEGEISDAERDFQDKFEEINNAIRAKQIQRNKYDLQNPYPLTKGRDTDATSNNEK